ncbi:hypothetical protein Tco_0468059 [Tanacetum coccineum]
MFLQKNGPITLKVYREDGTSEIILDFKASDLHLIEWREVIQGCPKRTRAVWNTIYGKVKTRMSTKKFKSSVQYEDHLAGTMLNEPILGLAHVVTTRSGVNYKPPVNPLEENEDYKNEQNKHKDGRTNDKDEVSQLVVQKRMMESYVPPILFPGRLKKEKEKEQFRKFFKNLQQLSIDNLFVEALEKIPKYAKFMKDLLMNKAKFKEASKVTLNER